MVLSRTKFGRSLRPTHGKRISPNLEGGSCHTACQPSRIGPSLLEFVPQRDGSGVWGWRSSLWRRQGGLKKGGQPAVSRSLGCSKKGILNRDKDHLLLEIVPYRMNLPIATYFDSRILDPPLRSAGLEDIDERLSISHLRCWWQYHLNDRTAQGSRQKSETFDQTLRS